MKNTRDWFNDAQWIEYGDGDGFTAAYASATSFTIAGGCNQFIMQEEELN